MTTPTPKPIPAKVGDVQTRNCETHGEYEAEYSRWGWTACEKCIEADRIETERREAEDNFKKRLDAARIPPRFRNKGFAEYEATLPGQKTALMVCRKYAEEFLEQKTAGRCLVLIGKPGTGKTHLALAIGQEIVARGFSARYVTVQDAIEQIRETWRADSSERESSVLKRLAGCDLLILDEVGVQYGKESEQVELFKFLNKRYNDVLPTLVISNVAADDLKRFLGERAFDRLRENDGKVLVFDWDSNRGK